MSKKVLLVLMGGVVLVVGYYFISPLFITVSLDEAVPVSVEDTTSREVATSSVVGEVERAEEMDSITPPVESVQPTPVPKTEMSAAIVGTPGHPASGAVRILKTAAGEVVRMEDFETINGPDLFVYLTTDLEATEFVDLGELKATEGNINYSVPEGVDTTAYSYVVVWCKQFGVLFNYADITSL